MGKSSGNPTVIHVSDAVCKQCASYFTVPVTPAYASVPPMPNTNWSFYVNSTSTTTMYNLGCNQGTADAADGANSFVTLDFGGQDNANTGTVLPKTTVTASYSTVENLAEVFASVLK